MTALTLNTLLDRLPKGVTPAMLARVAGVHPSHLSRMRAGKLPVPEAMLARLRYGVVRLRTGEGDAVAINALNRALIVICAVEMGQDPLAVQGTDPNSKQMRLEGWLARVFVHWVARHVMCDCFGLKQAQVAEALGVTRQAVHKSVRQVIEREEQDPAFAAALERIQDKLLGGAL